MRNSVENSFLWLLLFIVIAPSHVWGDDNQWSYRRNSLCSIMIGHPEYKFSEELEKMYRDIPMPERFNDHNLGVRVVEFGASDRKDQTDNINNFIEKVNLPQKMVSRWFSRNKNTGTFNMDLVKARGAYDANIGDIQIAQRTLRGKALLEDAGEELIPNTYVVFNDIIYSSRSGVGSVLKMFGSVYLGSVESVQSAMQEIGGFKVTINSYLYKLVWNDSIATTFYNNYYTENENEKAKQDAYKNSDLFKLQYVGVTQSSESKTSFVGVKDPAAELRKILGRTIDKNISDLMHKYPDFRIKAPLISTEPVTADIGLKEGVDEDSQFEVLMPEYQPDGKLTYKRYGIIKPVKGKIKDNRYMASDLDGDLANLNATEFEIINGKDFVPGMLIREL